jgi:hypothetical protein
VKVFISMPSEDASLAYHLAVGLTQHGYDVLSCWHNQPKCEKYPRDRAVRLAELEGNLAGINAADVVVVSSWSGIPRTTLSEVGYAIAKGKRVVWVQPYNTVGRTLFDVHPLVTTVEEPPSWVEARDAIVNALDALEV